MDAPHLAKNEWVQVVVKQRRRKRGPSASSSLPEIAGASKDAPPILVDIGRLQAHRRASFADLRKLMCSYLSACPQKFRFLLNSRVIAVEEEASVKPLLTVRDSNSVGEIVIERRDASGQTQRFTARRDVELKD